MTAADDDLLREYERELAIRAAFSANSRDATATARSGSGA